VAGGEHEFVGVGVLGAAVIVAKAARLGAGQMDGDVIGSVGERSAEVPGLRIVAEQGEGHTRHEPDVFQIWVIRRV
jgi:hypothetical protein